MRNFFARCDAVRGHEGNMLKGHLDQSSAWIRVRAVHPRQRRDVFGGPNYILGPRAYIGVRRPQ